jgi:hypothetical protein
VTIVSAAYSYLVVSVAAQLVPGTMDVIPAVTDTLLRSNSTRNLCREYVWVTIASGPRVGVCLERGIYTTRRIGPVTLTKGQRVELTRRTNFLGTSVESIVQEQ